MGRDEDEVRLSEYWVNGALIVGAGPAGLAVAACLREQGVPCVVLERSDCIASLWEKRTYDRLKLHLPKRFCQLPLLPFPPSFPEYPSRSQFLSYLRSYASRFDIAPQFGANVASARRDEQCGVWRVCAYVAGRGEVEYVCQWLVVATGENAELFVPAVEGLSGFHAGPVMHAADYKSGEAFRGKRTLVVGCGNSGMEVCLDLCHHGASPTMVVRDSVHVLPREVLGKSTFGMSVAMMRWLPVWLVDKFMLAMARLTLGDVERYGLRRPAVGPLELKSREGKTPVLDIGTLAKIKSGDIKVVPEVRSFMPGSAQLVDGRIIEADAVVLATGYRSNVTSWLKGTDFFTSEGFPRDGWKGKCGLYAVGFTRRGLSGISQDAVRIAEDLGKVWREETKQAKHITASCHNRCS